ncbi:MAG: hypothetical protein AB7F50_04815 [Fimbriimonadaceae bacterium]
MTTLFASALLAPATLAAPADHKIVAVSLFKNGYAVITRVSDVTGIAETEIPAPDAVLGTFWFGTSTGTTLTEARIASVAKEVEITLGTLESVLAANVGRTVTVETLQSRPNQVTEVTGKIKSFSAQFLLLELVGGKVVAMNPATVVRIVADGELRYTTKSASFAKTLKVITRGDGKVFTLAMQRGMTWSPSYQVDITDEKTLQFRSKAVILNDLEDFSDVDVRLITGFPSIKYLGALDPFTLGASAQMFGGGLPSGGLGGGVANMGQVAGKASGDEVSFGNFDSTGTGQQLEDLFFYTVPGVQMKRGDRLYRPLFQSGAEYKHIYKINLSDRSDSYTRQSGSYGGTREDPVEAIHVIEFRNTSGQPLTTAPALVMKSGEVIGQDEIRYTPTGDTVELKVGKALEIQSDEIEEQLERVRGFIKDRHGNDRQDLITVKATVTVVNRKPKAVAVRVSKSTFGELLHADNGGKGVTVPSGLGSANPGLKIEWNMNFKPGERKTLTFTYTILVPPIG